MRELMCLPIYVCVSGGLLERFAGNIRILYDVEVYLVDIYAHMLMLVYSGSAEYN